ncbi:MAG: hypothetical protein ABGY41_22765, partial [Candidatus Poribacteria bacterium]
MRTYPRAIRDGIALLTVALALALAIGCSAPSSHDSLWQEPRALGTAVPSPLPPTDPALEGISTAVETPGSLTVDDAIRLALTANPALAAAGWDVRGAEAAAWQAGLRPNPELAFEAEEMVGSGGLSGFHAFAASVSPWKSSSICDGSANGTSVLNNAKRRSRLSCGHGHASS